MAYNEIAQRGSPDFPVDYFYLDEAHSKYNMAAHWHSEIELLHVLEGEFEATLNNNSYILKKGDALFMNSETLHKGTPKNCVYECIVFHLDFLYNERYDAHSFIKSIIDGECKVNEYFPANSGKATDALNKIFDALSNQSAARKFRVISSFYNFFAEISDAKLYDRISGKRVDANSKKLLKLKEILLHLRTNYTHPFSLKALAQATSLSPQYLSSFFKSMTDKSPIEYLTEYRIEKAAHKLRSTEMNVTEIAYACGFSDLSYFIKMFKKLKGVSPGKYRSI